MGSVTESIENYEVVLKSARNMVLSGAQASDVLRYLVIECGILGKAQLIIVFCKGFGIELRRASCIGGWWHDDSGELSDERINELLNPELSKYVSSHEKS
ncbi:hypothetical protein [Hahella chejuensis]|uniref:hypothetical protein n=1 Tax=Hahella chejuensis TaxID=158327 RepID=UPI0013052388|nr:hypothetical protein [Hahella chejuensis]